MQAKVMDCMCVYGCAKGVARRLGISPKTVHIHMSRIYDKMDMLDTSWSSKPLVRAIVEWTNYWLTDEAKATLRNAQLTHTPRQ